MTTLHRFTRALTASQTAGSDPSAGDGRGREFQDLVAEMALCADLEPPVVRVVKRKAAPGIHRDKHRQLILIAHPRLTRAPTNVQRQVIGHEVEHALLGHLDAPEYTSRQRALITTVFAGALLMTIPAIIALVVIDRADSLLQRTLLS
jgi:hypothetical protein